MAAQSGVRQLDKIEISLHHQDKQVFVFVDRTRLRQILSAWCTLPVDHGDPVKLPIIVIFWISAYWPTRPRRVIQCIDLTFASLIHDLSSVGDFKSLRIPTHTTQIDISCQHSSKVSEVNTFVQIDSSRFAFISTSPFVWVQSIAISVSVCLFVCSSVCRSARLSQKPQSKFYQILPNFMYMLRVAVARLFSDGRAKRYYVLSVLWMMSCFHTMEQIGQNKRRRVYFVPFARWRHQLDVTKRYLIELLRCCHRGRRLPSLAAFYFFWVWWNAT